MKWLKIDSFVHNLSWVLIGNGVHAALAFFLNLYSARCFSVAEYGIINYAVSLVALASSLCNLGINSIITKKFTDNERESGGYIGTSIILRIIASLLAISVLYVVVTYIQGAKAVTQTIVLIQGFSILFSSLDVFVYWYRYQYRANFVAISRMVALIFSAVLKIISIEILGSVVAFIISGVLETLLLGSILGCAYIKNNGWDFYYTSAKAKELLKLSYPFIFSSILVSIYSQTDKIMLQALIDENAVALYSASYTIANVICIIPSALVEAYRPEIMKYKNQNHLIYIRRLKQVYSLVFWLGVMYGVFVIAFKEIIISILYGENYLKATQSLIWIVWYSVFAYFGAVTNLYLIAEDKVKWVQVLTAIGVVANIVLNFVLIPKLGISGAAIASLMTQIIANVIVPCMIPPLRPSMKLMFRGVLLECWLEKGILNHKNDK